MKVRFPELASSCEKIRCLNWSGSAALPLNSAANEVTGTSRSVFSFPIALSCFNVVDDPCDPFLWLQARLYSSIFKNANFCFGYAFGIEVLEDSSPFDSLLNLDFNLRNSFVVFLLCSVIIDTSSGSPSTFYWRCSSGKETNSQGSTFACRVKPYRTSS